MFFNQTATIYEGLNGTGNVLATVSLPIKTGTPLYNASSNTPVVMPFAGTAHSVVFSLNPGASDIDNIIFNATQAPGLLSLSADEGALSPDFQPDVTTYTLAPVMAATVNAVTLTAHPASNLATMNASVNNGLPITLTPDQPTPIAISGCPNLIKVTVTTPGAATRVYEINVSREGCASQAVFASTIYRIGKGDKITIQDARITPTSIILLQYVGGGKGKGDDLRVESIVAGAFTAHGKHDEPFRYVIIN